MSDEILPTRIMSFYMASNAEQPVRIEICDTLPETKYSRQDAAIWAGIYTSQSKELERALWKSLPGAIYDRVFAAMAERKASQYRVLHEPRDE